MPRNGFAYIQESSSSLQKNVTGIEESLFHTGDLIKRPIRFDGKEGMILYIDSLTDTDILRREVLEPLARHREGKPEQVLPAVDLQRQKDLDQAVEALIAGKSILMLDGDHQFFIVGTAVFHKRDMKEPENESVVRGPHDGFTEELAVNLYSIRKRIESPNLTVRFFKVGKVFVQEFTEDHTFSLFPQHLNTERPDRTVAHLMEGRVALLAEQDPTALIVPVTLFAFYHSPDDYHSRWPVASFIRMIRLMSFLIAFQLPAFYIATVAFHPEILPVELIFTVKSTLQQVPFPPILEALLMELIFEFIREAGIRLPSRVGQTIGIVGGLVIGDAIVRAGLVSYTMIIVVALTAISSFLVPSNEMSAAIRIMRFPLMVAAATFGYIGISFGLMIIFIHLCALESFGTPYLAPAAPLRLRDMKDTFLRFPIWKMNRRPHDAHPQRMKQESNSRGWARRGQRKK